MTRVALLRGVNVGRNKRIAMAELRDRLEQAGHRDVRTIGQSGNVVFTSRASAASLERSLGKLIGVEVIVRTDGELAKVVALDPLRRAQDNGSRHLVTFLRAPLSADIAAALQATAKGSEAVAVHGREVYSWHPDGLHGSEVAKLLVGAKLGVIATGRNWNTVLKLHELAGVQ